MGIALSGNKIQLDRNTASFLIRAEKSIARRM